MVCSVRHSGFVLLMVLMVLVVCGTVLAAAARRCGDRALLAGNARQQLQLKWGTRSCRDICLFAADSIIHAPGEKGKPPAITARREVAMGGITFQMIVSDEQSKANVNFLEKRFGRESLAAGIRQLQSSARKALQVNLNPNDTGTDLDPLKQPYSSFDQIFAYKHPLELVPIKPQEDPPLNRITCWGSGLLNFKKAELPVMRKVLAGLLTQSQMSDLVKFRATQPDCTLKEALDHLELKKKRVAALRGVLTDMSLCHSLWIVARGKTRSWCRFYVTHGGGADSMEVFAW